MNNAKNALSKNGGFTLVEVLLALVIVGASILIISQGLASSSRASAVSQETTAAAQLAAQKMAEVEAGAIDYSRGSSGTVEPFTWQVIPGTSSATDLFLVTVKITWKEYSYELHRYICASLRKR